MTPQEQIREIRKMLEFIRDTWHRLPYKVEIERGVGMAPKTLTAALSPNIPYRTLPKKHVVPLGKYLEQYGFERNKNLEKKRK